MVGAGAAQHVQRVELSAVPIIHAIVLGLVQGLSEFLPISSSGHLILVPWLFDWHDFDSTSIEKAFDVALHLGTLVAVVGYFRKDLVIYVREGLRLVVRRERPVSPEGKLAWLLVVSSVPAAAVGAVFEKTIDDVLGTPTLIAVLAHRLRCSSWRGPTVGPARAPSTTIAATTPSPWAWHRHWR